MFLPNFKFGGMTLPCCCCPVGVGVIAALLGTVSTGTVLTGGGVAATRRTGI